MEQTEYVDLLGRVAALELIMKSLVTHHVATAAAPGDPIKYLDNLRSAIFGSAQKMQRPIGEINDAAWDVAVASMEKMFREVSARLKRNQD